MISPRLSILSEEVGLVRIKAILGVIRAPFLLLPVTLVVAGSGAAAFEGCWSWRNSLIALVGLAALHAAVNVLNEIIDYKTGIDFHTSRTPFSGGSGTLPAGLMKVRGAWVVAVVSIAIGGSVGLYFLGVYGTGFLPVVLLGAVCVLGYANIFARTGIGEIAAGLGLGGLAVYGDALVQCGQAGALAAAAGVPAFLMTFNLLLLNEFPDEGPDRSGGRRNLVLLFGRPAAAKVYAAAAIAVPVWITVLVVVGWFPLAALVAVAPSLLLVQGLTWAFRTPNSPVPVSALAANVMWNLLTNMALGIALLLAA